MIAFSQSLWESPRVSVTCLNWVVAEVASPQLLVPKALRNKRMTKCKLSCPHVLVWAPKSWGDGMYAHILLSDSVWSSLLCSSSPGHPENPPFILSCTSISWGCCHFLWWEDAGGSNWVFLFFHFKITCTPSWSFTFWHFILKHYLCLIWCTFYDIAHWQVAAL